MLPPPVVHDPANPSASKPTTGTGELTITPDRRLRVLQTFLGWKTVTNPSAYDCTTLPGGCARAVRFVDGGAFTVVFASGSGSITDSDTALPGEGYSAEIATVTASGRVRVFW